MSDPLETLKRELEQFGAENDAATDERPRRMLNITRDTGEFLSVLVRATLADQMASFVALVNADAAFTTCLVPVGNGEFLAVKLPT